MIPFKFRSRPSLPFWLNLLGIVFIMAVVGYHFFVNLKCPSYPWFHAFDDQNDIDGSIVAQTLALLNQGDLVYVDHPDGTNYMLYGFFLRIMARLIPAYRNLLDLAHIPNLAAAFDVLNKGMFLSRIFTFFLMIVLLLLMWRLLLRLSKQPLVAFLLAFFFFTTGSTFYP